MVGVLLLILQRVRLSVVAILPPPPQRRYRLDSSTTAAAGAATRREETETGEWMPAKHAAVFSLRYVLCPRYGHDGQ